MILYPNCKINLGLNILRRRADGYHDIETLMYPVGWCDILEITPAIDGQTALSVSGNAVDCPPEKNLVTKAYNAVKAVFPSLPAVEINLHKIIPDGAGLGGGSADAAFMIRGLNEMFDLGMDDVQMACIAVSIGADCPFFIYNRPMLATGIGDVLEDESVDLSGYALLVAKPCAYVSTKEAYAGVVPDETRTSVADVIKDGVRLWRDSLTNGFETSVFVNHPEIAELKERMYSSGAVYASMTGSGAAVFGIFDSIVQARALADTMDIPHYVTELR